MAPPEQGIIDAQIHIWPAETERTPWVRGGRDYAHAPEYSAHDALIAMNSIGVDRAVLVPPSFHGDTNGYCLDAAADYPDRFCVFGRIDWATIDLPSVERWRRSPGMRGMRITTSRRWEYQLAGPDLSWFWAATANAGIPVMISPGDQVEQVGDIAKRYPGLLLILDRFGVPVAATDHEAGEWLARAEALAACPNIAVKITGASQIFGERYPFERVQPAVYRMLDAYGRERVFWGSDLTRIDCTYRDSLRLVTEALVDLSDLDRSWILGRGLSEWINWD